MHSLRRAVRISGVPQRPSARSATTSRSRPADSTRVLGFRRVVSGVALSLRLSSHRLMTTVTGAAPVLLLDDAFSELDEATARALVGELPDGQALLTTAGELPPGAAPKLVVSLVDGRLEQ